MILDRLLRFSNGQTLVQAVGTVASTDVVDFGLGTSTDPQIPTPAQGGGVRDMGIGDKPALKLLVQLLTALTSGGAGTLQVHLQGAPDDGAGAPGSFVTYWSSPIYTLAQGVAGARLLDIDFPRPPQGQPVPRFFRLLYQVATADLTGGTVWAGIVPDRDDQMYNGSDNAVQGGYRPGIAVAN